MRACFHAQQITEKCLKAFLANSQVAFPYTHNLTKLVELCVGLNGAFSSLLPTVKALTPYAVELRYDDSFWPTSQVAKEARLLPWPFTGSFWTDCPPMSRWLRNKAVPASAFRELTTLSKLGSGGNVLCRISAAGTTLERRGSGRDTLR